MAKSYDDNLYNLVKEQKEQFIIPVYQRGYNWKEDNVKKLMDDLLEFAKDNLEYPEQKYFVGNVITKEIAKKSLDEQLNKFVIVDGQQRITTTLLMLWAIYKYDPQNYPELENIFLLREKGEEKIKIDRLSDGQTFRNIIMNNIKPHDEETNIYKNYKFIFNKINKERLAQALFNSIQKSLIINVKLSKNENENKVFETINSSGKPLSEGDLIKNFIFFYSHSFDKSEEKELLLKYEKSILQIDVEEINDFYRYFSVVYSKDKKLPSLSKHRAIFNKVKLMVEENDWSNQNYEGVRKIISKIKTLSNIWKFLTHDSFKDIEKNFLLDIVRNSKKTYFTLLSELFINFNIDFKEEISQKIIKILGKLIIFRNINGDPDKNITRDVPYAMIRFKDNSLYEDSLLGFESWLNEYETTLKYPAKEEMISSAVTNQIYKNKKQTQNVLKTYEFSIRKNGTEIDWTQKFTIEHVMPKKFDKKWYPNLKDKDYKEYLSKSQYIDTLGNLTLLTLEMNAGLREDIFEIKKNGKNKTEGFLNDALKMNKEFSEYNSWDIENINERAEKIVKSIYEWFSK